MNDKMETKKQIEEGMYWTEDESANEVIAKRMYYLVEVLVDIRDLLKNKKRTPKGRR